MSLTHLLIPTYKQMLGALSDWLNKAHAQVGGDAAQALLSARLADDMHPLSTQIRFVCLQAQEPFFRFRREPLPETLEQLALEGRNANDQPGSMVEAQARISEALSFLAGLGEDALEDGAQSQISIELPNGMTFDMNAEQYARDWALPQFYFHLNTAYAILRNNAIELGKADYVQHMFAYLRPGSMPQD